jgi:hypothetical protein
MASPSTALLSQSESYPSATDSWTVSGMNLSGVSVVVHARAVCARD